MNNEWLIHSEAIWTGEGFQDLAFPLSQSIFWKAKAHTLSWQLSLLHEGNEQGEKGSVVKRNATVMKE